MIITFIVLFYLFYNDISFGTRKLAVILTSFIISMVPVPGISMLPDYSFGLFMIRWIENSDRMRKFAEKKAAVLTRV